MCDQYSLAALLTLVTGFPPSPLLLLPHLLLQFQPHHHLHLRCHLQILGVIGECFGSLTSKNDDDDNLTVLPQIGGR